VAEGGAGRVLVLGVGNPDRGDDAAGRAVAQRLRGGLPVHVEVQEAGGEAGDLLGRLEHVAAAFVVDACVSGAAAGAIHRFDVSRSPLPQGAFAASTHGFGLREAIELARALGRLPSRCVVYAIEGEGFEVGAPLSPAVAAAVIEVAGRVRAEFTGGDGGST
jgi:hydrogenase maturation protease